MKLTLNQTWKYCLRMWKWITEQIKKGNKASIWTLKEEWLKNNGFKNKRIRDKCFFCNYCHQYCEKCPACLIEGDFYCMDLDYDYIIEPIKFYNKLIQLNEKRLQLKKKGIKNV